MAGLLASAAVVALLVVLGVHGWLAELLPGIVSVGVWVTARNLLDPPPPGASVRFPGPAGQAVRWAWSRGRPGGGPAGGAGRGLPERRSTPRAARELTQGAGAPPPLSGPPATLSEPRWLVGVRMFAVLVASGVAAELLRAELAPPPPRPSLVATTVLVLATPFSAAGFRRLSILLASRFGVQARPRA